MFVHNLIPITEPRHNHRYKMNTRGNKAMLGLVIGYAHIYRCLCSAFSPSSSRLFWHKTAYDA